MPALLSFDPAGAVFSPITLDNFTKLLADLKADSRVSKLSVDGFLGSCEVQGVDFDWTYNAQANSLHISITAKHGFLTSRVPNAAIFDELRKQFFSQI